MGRQKHKTVDLVRLDKLVHGGQCLAITSKGRRAFVWGGLPGELVNIRVTKDRKSYIEGTVTKVVEQSKDRIEPEEPISYLSTSPWQIMTYDLENKSKQQILEETYTREGVRSIKFNPFVYTDQQYGYRNKQEYGFWGDDKGIHIAHYVRGTHGKQIVQGSKLAKNEINNAARAVRYELNRLNIWGGKLKTLVLRSSDDKKVVGALFIKEKIDFSSFILPKELKGLDIYFSDPRSPASVATEKLYSFGDIKLMDTLGGVNITYDVMSFFQVNLPVFEKALISIKALLGTFDMNAKVPSIVDMYSGVGTIGIVVGAAKLVESEDTNVVMATENIEGKDIKVIQAASESATEHITKDSVIIVDPPRAGLHKNLVARILEAKPQMVMYLSCNPSTQARDVKLLEDKYKISSAQGFNFFPRTPHIESLVVLKLEQ